MRVSTKVMEIMLILQFLPIFSFFLRPFSNAISSEVCGPIDQILCEASWGWSILKPWKLYMQIEHFLQLFLHFSAKFSNTICSEVPEPIDFKFYVRHPGVGPYQNYGNYDFWSVIIDIYQTFEQTR